MLTLMDALAGSLEATRPHVSEGDDFDSFIQKICDFNKVSKQAWMPDRPDALVHQLALMIYSVVPGRKEIDAINQAVTDCLLDEERTMAMGQSMIDGIAWVKAFRASNAEEALRMAREKEAQAATNPEFRELITLAKLALFDARYKQKAERLMSEKEQIKLKSHFDKKTRERCQIRSSLLHLMY